MSRIILVCSVLLLRVRLDFYALNLILILILHLYKSFIIFKSKAEEIMLTRIYI